MLPIQTVRETPLIWRFLPTRDFNADAPDAGITVDFTGADSGTVSGSATGTDTFDGIEHVLGSSANDVFKRQRCRQQLHRMGGDDTFNGSSGLDIANYAMEAYEASVRTRILAELSQRGAIVNLSGVSRTIDGVVVLPVRHAICWVGPTVSSVSKSWMARRSMTRSSAERARRHLRVVPVTTFSREAQQRRHLGRRPRQLCWRHGL